MKKEEILKSRIELAINNTKNKFKVFNDCDAVYHGSGKTQFTNSKIYNPYSWANVETIVPRMVAQRPSVEYKPREPQDEFSSQIHTALFEYWWDKDQAFEKVVSWIKNALIYGTGVVKLYWKTTTKDVTSYEYDETGKPLIDENGEFFVKKEQITDFDDPCLEVVNVYDFFVDPEATDIQTANWVIHRYYKTLDELESAGYYKNLKKLRRFISKIEKSPEEIERHELAFGHRGEQDDTVDKIEIWEMWDHDGLTVLAAGEVLIREQANPFWHGQKPFISLKDSVVPHEFYGKGEIEPVIKLQHALNTIQNQIVDNRTQVLMNMWKITGENVDETELIYRPNGVIHLSSEYEKVEPIVPPDLTGNAQKDLSLIKSDIQQALGIYDYTKGSESGTNKTATGIGLIQEAANARFNHKIQLLEEALKSLGEMVLALYQQFITDEKVIRVTGKKGEDFVRVIPREIAGQYDCVPEAGSTLLIDKQKEREDVMNLYAIFSPEPFENLKMELKRKILQKFGFESLEDALDQDIDEWTQKMFQENENQQIMAEQQAIDDENQMMMAQEQSQLEEQKRLEEDELKQERELEKIALSKSQFV
jgi:hypothetical protein